MLPTFVIGLREGLEAALIVGIVATFLVQQQRRDVLKWVWLGVGVAVVLCSGVAVALHLAEQNLPQQEQEGLETIVGLAAVGMVTWMVVWMRKHSRGLKHHLEAGAAAALAAGSIGTLVFMAFLAVLREGLETAVFLLAAFSAARDPAAAGWGATLGIVLAVGIGYGIYKGGIHINLQKFFTVTGVVLVLVAAGLLATAAHTAHEAGWVNFGQSAALDLTWLVDPGSIRSALLTGMLGIQPQPVAIEVVVWLLYAVPMTLYVLWPTGRRTPKQGDPVPPVDDQADTPRPDRVRSLTTGVSTSVVGVVVLALIAAGCGSDSSGSSKDTAGAKHVEVTLTDEGCSPQNFELAAGPTVFKVSNEDSSAVTEFEILQGDSIVSEVENIAAGFERDLAITLEAGKYTTWCKGGSENDGKGKLVVTAAKAAAATNTPAQDAAISTYRTYLEGQTAELVTGTQAFVAAVQQGDVDKAKSLYAATRAPYERIEPVAESFGDLDPAIDAREGDVPDGEWTGFHKIEQALWVHNSLDGMAPIATKLLSDVQQLDRLVKTVKLEPATIANGALALLDEVSATKVQGEEERYSRTDLDDIQANVDGSKAAFAAVAPLLPKSAAATEQLIGERFAAVQAILDPLRTPTGFVSYDSLTPDQTRAIAEAVNALAEPLSEIPKQLVTGAR